jgi:hypothetical protein
MPMRKFEGVPARKEPKSTREKSKDNLTREAKRQVANERKLNRVGFTGEDISRVADDKSARENYGPGTRRHMEPRLAKARRKRG